MNWPRLALLILITAGIGLAGAWLARQRAVGSGTAPVELAAVSQLPEAIRTGPALVRQAYQFAVANQDVLNKIPCYCGCGSVGHDSNLDCFVERFDPDGSVAYSYHGFE